MATYDTESYAVAEFLANTMTTINNNYAKKIKSACFENATALTTASFGAITTIESSAFSGCTALTTVTLPSTLTAIASTAFNGCSNLTINIDLPSDTISGAPWGATNATINWRQLP